MKLKPLDNTTYGRLTVLERRGAKALCRCVCGVEKEVMVRPLREGQTLSCGCLRAERVQVHDAEVRTWPEYKAFRNMHHRGDLVDARWTDFYRWWMARGRRPSPAHELTRADTKRGWVPGNVRWEPRIMNRTLQSLFRIRPKIEALQLRLDKILGDSQE